MKSLVRRQAARGGQVQAGDSGKGGDLTARQGHVVLVLGIARSGTSAVSGVLSRLGVDFGTGLKPADALNPKGFYEDFEISRLNQRVLAALGRTWSDAQPLPKGWCETGFAAKARADLAALIVHSFGDAPVVGLKDPRIVRLLPLYLGVAADLGRTPWLVAVTRRREAVIRSIGESGYFHGEFSPAKAARLCDAYAEEMAIHSADEHRIEVAYEELFDGLPRLRRRLMVFFDFPLRVGQAATADLHDFIDPALCRNQGLNLHVPEQTRRHA